MTETCEDTRGQTGVVTKCGDQVDFVTGEGDSGAPVFRYSRYGNAEFRGIVYGYEDVRHDEAGRKGWFQDLEQIEWDLGTLNVMDPGSPRVEVLGRNLVSEEEECTWTAYMRRGLEPLSYGWSGILHGSGPSITGVAEESGWLKVMVTDPLDRTDRDSLEVRVGRGSPRCRDIDDDDNPGGDTLRLPPPPSGP